MDHHTSWFSFLPGYAAFQQNLVDHYSNTVVYGAGISTVHHVFAAVLVMLILLVLTGYARTKVIDVDKAIVPPRSFGAVAFLELFLEALLGTMKSVIGHDYKRYVPVIGTLGLFILVSNLLGLVPGMLPPTDNLNTTMVCGLIVFFYFNYHGLRTHGLGHITHILNPIGKWWGWFLSPLLGAIEIVSVCVRPISLGLRLAGNMTGDHAVLLVFAGIFPLLLPLPFYVLGLMICVIQTAVFCILSCVYISLHTAEAEDH